MTRIALALTLVLTLGCALLGPPPEERAWIEIRTPAFQLVTDLDPASANALVDEVELFRAVVARVTNVKRTAPRVPTRIYALARRADFVRVRPGEGVAGFMSPQLRENVGAFSASPRTGIAARPLLFHEYTHLIVSNESSIRYPLWWSEGFAELLSSVEADGEWVILGRAPSRMLPSPGLPSYAQVVGARSYSGTLEELNRLYGRSWLILHYLTFGEPYAERRAAQSLSKRTTAYLLALESGSDPREAFEIGFEIPVESLSDEMKAYVGDGAIPVVKVPRTEFEPATERAQRALSPAEISLELGRIAIHGERHASARSAFERAIELDPQYATAHALLGATLRSQEKWTEARAMLDRALELDPDDFEIHVELGLLASGLAFENPDRAETWTKLARAEFERAIELAPENPEAHARLAATYVGAPGDASPGLLAARQAESLLPAHPEIQLSLARLYRDRGERETARRIALRLTSWGKHEGDVTDEAEALLAELDAEASATP